MRFASLLDSVYVFGSLWGGSGPHICAAPPRPPGAAFESVGPAKRGTVATAFVDVNVVPMDTERVLPHYTVLVERGQITALGSASQVKVPAGAVQIDGRGRYLIPGLVDMHGHAYGPMSLPHGVTAYRVMGNLLLRNSVKRYGDSTPYRYLSGNLRDFAQPGRRLDEIAAAYKAAGYDFVATENYMFDDKRIARGDFNRYESKFDILPKPRPAAEQLATREAIDSHLAIASLAGLPVGTHGGGHMFYPEDLMLRFGFFSGGSIEHLYGFMTGVSKNVMDDRVMDTVPNLRALAAVVQRGNIWITPTLGCVERKGSRIGHLSRYIVKVLQETGVRMLLGADDSTDVHRELSALVEAGLTPYQALLTGTRHPAEYFGMLDQVGTVGVGKRADLVLLEGNPLQDIYQTIDPVGVMLRGRWFPREYLITKQSIYNVARTYWPRVIQEVVRRTRMIFYQIDSSLVREFERDTSVESARHSLADSLASAGRAPSGHQRVFHLVAKQLGEYRARLTSAQQALFDDEARIWLRLRKRQGYVVMIPGVKPD